MILRSVSLRKYTTGTLLVIYILLGTACSTSPTTSKVIAKDSEFVVLRVGKEDAQSLARRYLGDKDLAWMIEDANSPGAISAGNEIIIPLKSHNPTGIEFDGYQTVPILCYHRFGDKGGRLEVSPQQFQQQLSYLSENGYRVIHLHELYNFLRGDQVLPKRSVVLTIDDGHRSIFEVAYPILKEFEFPATVFIYSDYMNNGGLKTKQLLAMKKSGLISIQPHSKTHSNLAVKKAGEGKAEYAKRVREEVRVPSRKLSTELSATPRFFAYPFGDANSRVIDELKAHGLLLGLTVRPAANAAFTYPYLLNRTMIFGDRGMDDFVSKLITFQPR
ncbi:MAG: polysaccharide deacetylase family protein [Candidatus Thiodiazotropha sp. 6PLUC2]